MTIFVVNSSRGQYLLRFGILEDYKLIVRLNFVNIIKVLAFINPIVVCICALSFLGTLTQFVFSNESSLYGNELQHFPVLRKRKVVGIFLRESVNCVICAVDSHTQWPLQ